MHLSDKEKAEKAHQALRAFFDQLGPDDIYKEAFFDVLLEVLYGRVGDNLSLPSEEEQIGDATSVPRREGEMPSYEID